MLHILYTISLKDMSARSLSPGLEPAGFQLKDGLTTHYITPPLAVSPDNSSKMRAFPYLIVRHDIERVPVQGEGHVPEDGAAILHHGHRLVQHSSFQRSIHSDLQRHRQIQRWMDSECPAAGHIVTTLLLYICRETSVVDFLCFVCFILHLQAPTVPPKYWCYEENIL